MWTTWIVVGMISVGSYYTLTRSGGDDNLARTVQQNGLADSMAAYRDSVVRYANQNPGASGSIADRALPLPDWYQSPAPGLWSNYIYPEGLIVIYATRDLDKNIIAEIAELAHGSAMAGQVDLAAGTIVSPARLGQPGPLPALPQDRAVTWRDRSPIWLAHR